MALFPDNNDGAVFIFVMDEFRREKLVRQSICNAYMANQTEMTKEYVSEERMGYNEEKIVYISNVRCCQIPCEDIYELPMISRMNFDSFEMVYRYIYKFMYNERDPSLEQPGFSHQTMQLKIGETSSFKNFNFHVRSNQL